MLTDDELRRLVVRFDALPAELQKATLEMCRFGVMTGNGWEFDQILDSAIEWMEMEVELGFSLAKLEASRLPQ